MECNTVCPSCKAKITIEVNDDEIIEYAREVYSDRVNVSYIG